MNAPFNATSAAAWRSAINSAADADYEVAIIDLGPVDVPTAAILANCNQRACGVDISAKVANAVNVGRAQINKRDLEGLVGEAITSEQLPGKVTFETGGLLTR